MQRPLSVNLLEGQAPRAQIQLGLVAARLAFPYWQRAFPEKESQRPLAEALSLVEAFCSTGKLPADGKAVAELAYQTVSSCDLPPGDQLRSAGFSVAHIAMAPWLLAAGSASKACHSAMVAINYSQSIHSWASKQSELANALASLAQELRDA